MLRNCFFLVKYFLAASVIFVCVSCGGKMVIKEPTTLPQEYVNPVFDPLPSVISIPLAIQPSFLENIVNNQLNKILYQNDSIRVIPGISNAALTVYRADRINIGLLGDELQYKIPLRLVVRVGVGVSALGYDLHQYQNIETTIALRMRSTITIDTAWGLATRTVIDGYDWISNPVIKVAQLTIPFTPVADLVLSSLKGKLGKIVDTSVKNNLALKTLFAPYWEQMQRPLLVNDTFNLWLKLTPQALSITQLRGQSGYLAASIGMKTIAQTYWGNPPKVDTIVPLPPLTIRPSIQGGFCLNLYSEMPYSQAQKISRQILCGKEQKIGGKKIIVEDIWLNGDGGLMRIDAKLSGAFKGTVTLIGRPHFDELTSEFSVVDVGFDMSTRSVLLSTARWMLNGAIQKKIEESLKVPLEGELTKSRSVLNSSLSSFKPVDYVTFVGSIDSLRVRGFSLSPESMNLAVQAQGRLGIKLERLLQIF
jgi:hypothetical protein